MPHLPALIGRMGKRPCPCVQCERSGNNLHDCRTVKKHTQEIAQGLRKRARPNVYGGAPAAADSDGGDSDGGRSFEVPDKTDAGWPGEAVRNDSESGADSDSETAPGEEWAALREETSVEVTELVGDGTVRMTGADAILKVVSSKYNPLLAGEHYPLIHSLSHTHTHTHKSAF